MKIIPKKFRDFFLCPCCRLPTLAERESYEICPLCNWEDDGQDDPNDDEVWGGPNGRYSLRDARNNFHAHQTMYFSIDLKMYNQTRMYLPWKRAVINLLKTAMETNLDSDWEVAQNCLNWRKKGGYSLEHQEIPNLISLKYESASYSQSGEYWVLNLSTAVVYFSGPFRFFQGDFLVCSSDDLPKIGFQKILDSFDLELENSNVFDAFFHERIGDFCLTFSPFKVFQVWPICPEKIAWRVIFNSGEEIIFGPGEKTFNQIRKNK